jgi:nucleoside-diphosphate-sugar epimerase
MKVLVTGGAGYVGSVLVPKLLLKGHEVKVLDIGYFGVDQFRLMRPPIEIVRDDVRRVCADAKRMDDALRGCDAVIHLAAMSNDPSAELNPELTDQVNFQCTKGFALAAKARGLPFLFSSSCSVYGESPDEVDEEGAVAPLTAYARSKVDSEQFLLAEATAQWRPVILRNGTLFGYSPRMRFDLVVNIFSYCSALYNEVRIFGDGMQWRPFLHVAECARAFIHFLEMPAQRHLVYNIAHENFRVVDLYDVFKSIKPSCGAVYLKTDNPDTRNYHVSTARMKEAGFLPSMSVKAGAEEMMEAIVTGRIADPEAVYYRNAKWMKELTSLGERDHMEIVRFVEAMQSAR